MGEKLTQKAFNEEMFDAIYATTLADSVTVSHLVKSALEALEEQGYDVPDYEETWEGGAEVEGNPKLERRVMSFTKRFQKLTGYIYG